MTAFLCLFAMFDPPQTKSYFLLRLCFVSDDTHVYAGREVWYMLQRGSNILQVGWVEPPPPPKVLRMPQSSGRMNIALRGEGPRPSAREEGSATPSRAKALTPLPKPAKVPKL